ncbi:hypothetical protein [Phenylobacterium sp.]|uniref:hypothetical protein n=1 Tax=Phenylobacterium sp. TaxID=1871053 RepID=UPI00271705FA|nr:hypothetical protein [Phenylobacterium sp.]MDO8380391.1 hypothetical protein [Phenylobacterium sp.]
MTSALGVFAPCAHAADLGTQAVPPAPNAFVSAMGQPLADFNINQTQIPDSLRKAVDDPYALDADDSCAAMAGEIAGLDLALGPDLDADAVRTTRRTMVTRAAAGAVRRLAVSWIPYRGVLRTVTGAESHARKAQEAALAGAIRRAYLKGLGQRGGCGPEAAPRRALAVAPEGDPADAVDLAPAQVVALDTP